MFATQLAGQQPQALAERLAKAEEGARLAKQAGNTVLYHEILLWNMHNLLINGDIATLDRQLNEQSQLARAHKQPFYQYYEVLLRAVLALARGDFGASERRINEALTLCRWLPGQDGEGVYGIQMFTLRREQGRLRELAPVVEHFVKRTPEQATWQPGLALIYAELGAREKAAALFKQLSENDFSGLARDGLWITCLVYLSEVCAFLGDQAAAEQLYRKLLPYCGHNVVIGINIGCLGAADRFLGQLAATLERWDDAETHFQRAVALNEQQGFRVWAAHSRADFAALLARRKSDGDRHRAQALLDQTLAEAEACSMTALKEKVLVLRQRVRSGPDGAAPSAAGLSKRELEVLRQVAAGKNNKEISNTLFISVNTVAAHIRNILDKTQTGNRTEAAAYAAEHGLLDETQ